MIMTIVAHLKDHPKVPEIEQLITAGGVAHAIELAAFAQGVGAMWRSGGMMFDDLVKQSLGVQANEQIIGFLYLGTAKKIRQVAAVDSSQFVSWADISSTAV